MAQIPARCNTFIALITFCNIKLSPCPSSSVSITFMCLTVVPYRPFTTHRCLCQCTTLCWRDSHVCLHQNHMYLSGEKWVSYWVSLHWPFYPPKGSAGVCVSLGHAMFRHESWTRPSTPAERQCSLRMTAFCLCSLQCWWRLTNLTDTSSALDKPDSKTLVFTFSASPSL